jgi:hypothetical protein
VVGDVLSDDELIRVLTKFPHEGGEIMTQEERDMSQYIMDRLHQCFQIPDDSVYEVMYNGTKKYKPTIGYEDDSACQGLLF